MSDTKRKVAREIAQRFLDAGDPLGWFEFLYSQAGDDASIIPWADLKANPNLIDWLSLHCVNGAHRALNVGCGLGDDAELISHNGYETTAFDISESAIAWCRARFPHSRVNYVIADLFLSPIAWKYRFDLVLESYTLQVLPFHLRAQAIRCVSSFVAHGGTLLVMARGRESKDTQESMPWALTKDELCLFDSCGLKQISFEDFMDNEKPPARRYRITYYRDNT